MRQDPTPTIDATPGPSPLGVLREDLDLTGTRDGYDGDGAGGSCAVVVDGRRALSPTRTTRRGLTLVDVLILVAMVAFLAPGVVLVAGRSRETADRVKCASNLKQIGLALRLYAADFGEWPRTRYRPETADRPVVWTGADSTAPFAETGPAPNDVTAAYRLLLAHKDLVPEVFLCPTSGAADLDFARARFRRDHANFADERELSYSFANPYPSAAVRDAGYALTMAGSAGFAIASDVNPGIGGPDGDVTTVTITDGSHLMRAGNSPNHDRDGQNVLYDDGHVTFVQNPFVGVGRDNVYTFGRRDDAAAGHGVVGPPTHAGDSVLLPTVDAELWRKQALRRNASIVGWVVLPAAIVLAATYGWVQSRRRRPTSAADAAEA